MFQGEVKLCEVSLNCGSYGMVNPSIVYCIICAGGASGKVIGIVDVQLACGGGEVPTCKDVDTAT